MHNRLILSFTSSLYTPWLKKATKIIHSTIEMIGGCRLAKAIVSEYEKIYFQIFNRFSISATN